VCCAPDVAQAFCFLFSICHLLATAGGCRCLGRASGNLLDLPSGGQSHGREIILPLESRAAARGASSCASEANLCSPVRFEPAVEQRHIEPCCA
jgi:hypothetical protein